MSISRLVLVAAAAMAVAVAGCGGGLSAVSGHRANASGPGAPAAHRKSTLGVRADVIGPCPNEAVFLRLLGEIRGYPLAATGPTSPCTDIVGSQTLLTGNGNGYGAMGVSNAGYLHALAFQSNGYGGLLVFVQDANGDATPLRAVLVDQDQIALAIDSHVNDYVVASQDYASDNCWFIVPTGALTTSGQSCDANVSAIFALAMTPQDELVVLGADATTGAARIDILANAATATPLLVRSISGPATGLPVTNSSFTFSLATDPVVGTIYVFSSADSSKVTAPKISEFASAAAGNVAPLFTLSGPLVKLPSASFAINVISVDCASNLYVNSTGVGLPAVLISVFAPGATGNVAPASTIEDDTLLNPSSGGIAVRCSTVDANGNPIRRPLRSVPTLPIHS